MRKDTFVKMDVKGVKVEVSVDDRFDPTGVTVWVDGTVIFDDCVPTETLVKDEPNAKTIPAQELR